MRDLHLRVRFRRPMLLHQDPPQQKMRLLDLKMVARIVGGKLDRLAQIGLCLAQAVDLVIHLTHVEESIGVLRVERDGSLQIPSASGYR